MSDTVDTAGIRVGILGAGIMGRGIAQLFAEAGMVVMLADARPNAANEARDFAAGLIRRKAEKGQVSAEQAEAAIARIETVEAGPDAGYAAFLPCALVIEAVAERIDIKHAVLSGLEAAVADDCIIATNTSSLSVTAIAAGARLPGRVAGFHFFNPAPLMKLVEVIGGLLTEEAVLERLTELARKLGHHPVRCADTPGFIVNHAGRAYNTEALRIVSEGICSFAELDRIMVDAAGFRMGPFELMDLTGLDVSHPVMEAIYQQYYHEPRYRPVQITAQRHAAGLFGRKTGRGFYAYCDGKPDIAPEMPVATIDPTAWPVWISRRNPGHAAMLNEALLAQGVTIEQGEKPSERAIIIVAPLGEDCTTAALAEGLDPKRTIAVDCLFGLSGRRTLMTNPATLPELADAAQNLLARGGHAVTRIKDSPGFVAQRMIAAIVNVGSDIAQQRVAAPDDIDRAVELGLGYRRGPLRLGQELGAKNMLSILQAMHDFYGDPRYRISPWLKRRALLGVDLRTPD